MRSLLQGLEVPVVVAPMAGGGSTPELVAAVSRAGGFGFLPGGGLDAAALAALIGAFRGLSDGPFGVNLLLVGPRRDAGVAAYRDRLVTAGWQPGEPRYSDDAVPAKLALLLDEPVPLVSFSFGWPRRANRARVARGGQRGRGDGYRPGRSGAGGRGRG
jgi:nitronate monooxygenase